MTMTQEEARRAIRRDWLARPESERTKTAAAAFAVAAVEKYPFKTKRPRDKYQTIMGWLEDLSSTAT
jgi:hypothetical protein